MSDAYDARLKQIEERNNLILGHFVHTSRGRLADDTLHQHVLNIQHLSWQRRDTCLRVLRQTFCER